MKSIAIASMVLVVVVACTTKPPAPPDYSGACRAIAGVCHPYDTGSGIGHDCHLLGHDGTDDQCGPKKAECIAACPPIDGGGHPDDAASDAMAEGDAPDPCDAFCTCMQSTCSKVSGYPYTMPGQCLTACKAFTSAELACFPDWCEQAKTGSMMVHLCEHGWGKYALDECK